MADKYDFKESEKKWREFWEKEKLFKFDKNKKGNLYIIDTPPPTVSGKMHIGHSYSYSQQDFVARFKRMNGNNVYYPFGTDDNGLPTERLIEKTKNVKSTKMSRDDFVKLCQTTLREITPDFVNDWKIIGMSCDFSNIYSTIDPHCIKTSQKSFLDLYKKNLVYQQTAPTMWCVQCQTAIAQAELEDKELDSTFNDVQFTIAHGDKGNDKITIATTRPELLPACVFIYVHPDDKRYTKLVGKEAIVPLFGQKVPIYADESANPEKGSGVLMVCSYGDKYDAEAIAKRKAEPRIVISKDGRMNKLAGKYENLTIKEARKAILEDLEKEGLLLAQKHIRHAVNVHDKCGTEIEFLTTKQWFIKILENRKKFIDAADKINWYPEHIKSRYVHWVEGLNWDWCISRQRHFGVSFPVWTCKNCGNIVVADEKDLPVDPLTAKPKTKCKCGSDDFQGEIDVMDTWATSSMSPQIITNWAGDKGFDDIDFKTMYPNTLRPQAHDIIRTWAFYTIVKGIYNNNQIPWKDMLVSGYVLDPKGEKMSKSKENTVEPAVVLAKYPADALRFGAAGAKLGEDVRYQEKDLITGLKTVTKLWNASRFAFMQLEDFKGKKENTTAIDHWMLTKLNKLIRSATTSFDAYEYAKVKSDVDQFFWSTLCDNYLEIIKDRTYNPQNYKLGKIGAQYTLHKSILSVLKMFAPIMPFITEEIYQLSAGNKKSFAEEEGKKSIHVSDWPKFDNGEVDDAAEQAGDIAVAVISAVRKYKSEKAMSLKTELEELTIELPKVDDKVKKTFEEMIQDIKATTIAQNIVFGKGDIEVSKDLKIS
ncbi:valine--tRNA ligase, partial [Candidatus Woesearchaeota archaeon]|nr:valine--tRNA ligase [Candidatus Woesearchaeota archaeon]